MDSYIIGAGIGIRVDGDTVSDILAGTSGWAAGFSGYSDPTAPPLHWLAKIIRL